MAYSSIVKPGDYFNTKLYTGNGGTQSITGVGFEPSLTWIKQRNGTGWHNVYDAVRGSTKRLQTNDTGAESTITNSITSFDSDGFSLGSNGDTNGSSNTTVSWNWLANGAGSANTDGSINTTATSANTTAGFSIVKFTGTGATATVGHGLGVAPSFYVIKRIDGGNGGAWNCYHKSLGATKYIILNSTNASATSATRWNDTAPTSSVFTVNTSGDVNDSGDTHIAYCFAEKKGYSKFGSYVGNGNADGTFVYTGFKPSFVIFKRATTSGASWCIIDTVRQPNNTNTLEFPAANLDAAEATGNYQKDFLSNGFKMRSATDNFNKSGDTYIYLAFAEQPLVANSGSNGVPATAK